MKAEQYITIQGWMRTELDLKGNDLLVYAIIYGFSQTESQAFAGSLQYLADWCGATKQGIQKNLKNLLERGLVEKHNIVKNGVTFCEYSCIVCNSVVPPMQLSCINNIENKQVKEKSNSKELLQPKSNLYSKCIALINDFTESEELRNLLITYLRFRLEIKDKPLYVNMFKGMLNKLRSLQTDGNDMCAVVQQSIDRGYLGFFSVKSFKKDVFSEGDGIKSAQYSEAEKKRIEQLDRQREAQGIRTRF